MQAEYVRNKDYDKHYISKTCPLIRYYSRKAMKKKYPKADYIVMGAIGDGLKEKVGDFVLGENKQMSYYTLKYARLLYGISGYVEIGEGKVLAVIKRKTVRNLVVLAGTCISLFCIVFAFMQILPSNGYLDENAKDYTPQGVVNNNTNPNEISLPGYGDVLMKADTDKLYLALYNPANNPCYFKYIIKLKNGDSLYESKLIPPGKAVTEVQLNHKMKKGQYDISIEIQSFDLKNKEKRMNGGKTNTTLIARES